MAAYFLDSSALVKRYVQERGTTWVTNLTDPSTGNLVYVARITAVEVVSGIARRTRSGGISASDAAAAIANLRGDFANSRLFS